MREVRDLHTPQIRRGDLQVPKLLGPKNKILGGTSKRHQCDIRSLQTARSRNKRRKTRAHSDSEIHLSGRSVKLQFGRGLPTSNKRGLDYISKPSTTTVRNDEPSGTHGLNRESHPMGKTLHERNAGRTSWLMAPGRIPRKPDCPDTTIQRRLTMVEGRMKLGGRATTATPAPQILLFTDNSTELKGAHIESICEQNRVRKTVPGGEASPHKCLGDESSSSGNKTFFTVSQQQSSIAGIVQHM